jgi:HSP20 family protein
MFAMDMDMDMSRCKCEGGECKCTSDNHCGCMEQPESMVYGLDFSIINGRPTMKEWGNMKSPFTGQLPDQKTKSEGNVEFIDNAAENKGKVIAEMPGVEKKDFQLTYREGELHINAVGETGKEYHEKTLIPVPVVVDSIKATYKNGVLEVTFVYEKISNQKNIKVE